MVPESRDVDDIGLHKSSYEESLADACSADPYDFSRNCIQLLGCGNVLGRRKRSFEASIKSKNYIARSFNQSISLGYT